MMQQQLFNIQPDFLRATFDGPDVTPTDEVRLRGQLAKVYDLMKDGQWRTLSRIAAITGASEAAASARLRDLRKPRFGSYTVNRRRVDGGLFEYQVQV
jgi:hypothetical protein